MKFDNQQNALFSKLFEIFHLNEGVDAFRSMILEGLII
jgi:hypothetical protein